VKYLSVCSGIEAASVAWHPLGWKPLAFSEIEPFPRAVLSYHYPDVPLHGDFTVLRDQPWIEDADVLVGGTPCQAFSVAGLRNSLSDERGNLSLEFVRLADAIDNLRTAGGRDPSIIVWENVPGVLSVKDNAFGCFLSGLAGDVTPIDPPRGKWSNAGVVDGPARTVAWRVLDAQYFGLAQRRRRVFVVASARDGFDPAAVLLEFEGVRRDTPPRRETGQAASGGATGRAGERSHWDGDFPHPTLNQSHNTGGVGQSNQELFSQRGAYLAPSKWPADIAPPLNASFGEKQGLEDQHALGGAGLFVPMTYSAPAIGQFVQDDVAGCLTKNSGGGGETQNAAFVAHVTHSLRAEGFDASEDGTGRGTPLVPVAFSYKDSGADAASDLPPTLRALGAYDANGGGQMAVALPLLEVGKRTGVSTDDPRAGIGIGEDGDPMFTLQAGAQHGVALSVSLRGRDGGDISNALRASQGGGDKPHVLAAVDFYANEGSLGSGNNTEMSPTLKAHPKTSNLAAVATNMAVRRLTPVECSRLQGFPDDYLLQVTFRGKCPPADGVMYKALGNSMAVPCMRWIATRIAQALEGELQ